MKEFDNLRYPIGKFKVPKEYTHELRETFIHEIEEAPFNLRKAVKGLNEIQFNTPYRKDGRTVEQVVHHIPESHMNAYIRFKLALTEKEPAIKTYKEDIWAKLEDYITTPVESSLTLLDALHKRWVILLRAISTEQFERKLYHPEIGLININWLLAQYAWHGKHHVVHIISLKKRMKW
jgi:DinB superfamily